MSPGSFSFYNDPLLVPLAAWRPDQREPARHAARASPSSPASRSSTSPSSARWRGAPWRRRLLLTVVGVGRRDHRGRLPAGGLPRAAEDLRPLAPALGLGGLRPLRQPQPLRRLPRDGGAARDRLRARGDLPARARPGGGGGAAGSCWARRRATRSPRWSAVVMVLVAGLLASQSRGGVSAFALAALAPAPRLARAGGARRSRSSLLVGLGVAWIGLGGVLSAFEARGVRASRLDLWRDMLPMVPRFPVFGDGLERLRHRLPLVPDRLEDGLDRRGAQRLPAGAPRRRGRRAPLLVAGAPRRRLPRGPRPRPALAARPRPSSAPSSASPSTASWTSTARSRPTPRPGSRSPPSRWRPARDPAHPVP